MDMPERFARGVNIKDNLSEDGHPSYLLYRFQDKDLNPITNKLELSINLIYEEEAITQLLNARSTNNPDEILYKYGVVISSMDVFQQISSAPNMKKYLLTIVKDALPNNEYHGNIQMINETRKNVRTSIAHSIAQICFLELISNPN